MKYFIVITIISIVQGIIFGTATNAIIKNKGYNENWFWWGFFFGIIAMIVAATKRQNITYSSDMVSRTAKQNNNEQLLSSGGWKCICGRTQASYVSSCSCGRSKRDVLAIQQKKQEEMRQQAENKSEMDKVSAIKEYNELLDAGIISQEEFDAKKKQLLGL